MCLYIPQIYLSMCLYIPKFIGPCVSTFPKFICPCASAFLSPTLFPVWENHPVPNINVPF